MNLEDHLYEMIHHPFQHACFLNSLSYLEYRGFRKIARSQSTHDIDLERLRHMKEEVTHAMLLKKMAIKVGGTEFLSYKEENLFLGKNMKEYFYLLDKEISPHARAHSYQAVTYAIEERAMEVYKAYESVLRSSDMDLSVALILKDEDQHLRHFKKFFSEDDLALFLSIERALFSMLWKQ